MLQIKTITETQLSEKVFLDDKHNASNTSFVRISDGYAKEARPKKIQKKAASGVAFFQHHHVKGKGFLYVIREGYTLVSSKINRGWSPIIEINEEIKSYVCYNFVGTAVNIEIVENQLVIINSTSSDAKFTNLGEMNTIFGKLFVSHEMFKGVRYFLDNILLP